MSMLVQNKTVVDLVRPPLLRAPLTSPELLRVLESLLVTESSSSCAASDDGNDDGIGGPTSIMVEELRLPVLDVPHVEALAEYLAAGLPATLHTIAVQELSSDLAFCRFCRALIGGKTYAFNNDDDDDDDSTMRRRTTRRTMIRRVVLGRTDQMFAKTVSIVGCNALANLLEHHHPDDDDEDEHTSIIEHLTLMSLRLTHPRILCRGLATNRSLTVLRLHNVQWGRSGDDENDAFFATLLYALSHVPIVTLSLEDMEVDVLVDDHDGSMSGQDNSCSGSLTAVEDETMRNPWMHLPHTLQTLRIVECSLCTAEVDALCQGLAVLPNLHTLILSSDDLLPSAAAPLGRLLQLSTSSRRLQRVQLDQNLLGTTGAATLLSFDDDEDHDQAYHHPLLSLDLSSNNIRDLAAVLEKATATMNCRTDDDRRRKVLQRLQRLDLSDNPLGPSILGVPTAVAQAFCHDAVALRTWRLDGCCLTDHEITVLCDTLVPPGVTELGLADNTLHAAGAAALRRLLEKRNDDEAKDSRAITRLDLSSCHITDATLCELLPPGTGATTSASTTTTMTTANGSGGGDTSKTELRELYLAFNKIGNDGLAALATYLRQTPCRLQTLNLQFNDFGAIGLRHLERVLAERNTSLQELYYWNNRHDLEENSSVSSTSPTPLDRGECEATPPTGPLTTTTTARRIDHWLSLNKAGVRQALAVMGKGDEGRDRPRGLWPPIIAHADRVYGAPAVFYILQNRPDLIYGAGQD